jgi:hypothetical protein
MMRTADGLSGKRRTIMAHVEYADMIKTVSGALVKINKKSQHARDQKMVLGTHRVADTTSDACSRIYLRGYQSVVRTKPLTPNGQLARARFIAVSAAVRTRAKNLSTYTTDQEAFEAQKNLAGGKKTFKSYLWKVCGDAYDEQHNG